jgi:hypothetical protein
MKDNEKGLGFNTEAPMWELREGGQFSEAMSTVWTKAEAEAEARRILADRFGSETILDKHDPADDTDQPMVEFAAQTLFKSDEDLTEMALVCTIQTEIEILSSHGQIFVFTDGTISRFEGDAEAEFGSAGIGISKFDLSVEALESGFADILNVGYWHANGYEAALTAEEWEN